MRGRDPDRAAGGDQPGRHRISFAVHGYIPQQHGAFFRLCATFPGLGRDLRSLAASQRCDIRRQAQITAMLYKDISSYSTRP